MSVRIFSYSKPQCVQRVVKQFACCRREKLTGWAKSYKLWPIQRLPLVRFPLEVETSFADDFREACLVIGDSEKASAALSRRCLQKLLIDKAGAKEKATLDSQIQGVIDSGKLPSHLTEDIDAIRNIGNFAVHPMGRKRIYASGTDRVRAFRARQRAEAAHRLDAPTPPVVAVEDCSTDPPTN